MPIKNDQFGLLNILAICGEVPDQLHIIYTRPSIAPIRLLKKTFCFYPISGSHPEVDEQEEVIDVGSGVQEIQNTVADAGGDFELTFEGQGLKLISAADAKGVVDKINSTRNFTTLTFSGNTVGIDAAEVIGKALENHSELKYAHWKDMFTGRMKSEIAPALKHLRLVFLW